MIEDTNRNIFHIMEIKIAQISGRYFMCKQMIESKENSLSSGELQKGDAFSDYVNRVENAYNILDESHRKIINNDFFYQNAYPFWWESCYSKSTYYRLKKEAMRKFLRTFANA